MAGGKPVSLTSFASKSFHRWIDDRLGSCKISHVFVFSGQMAQYLPGAGMRQVMDFVDLDSAKFAAYAEESRGPMRWLMRREARLLAAYERKVAGQVDASLFVSAAEAALTPGAPAIAHGIET